MIDLEQFLEKNILIFLDGKIERNEVTKRDRAEEYGLYLTKDYLKELSEALENDELSKAKKLFDELKNKYSKLNKNDPERKKMYDILEKMYAKIQQYVEIKEGKIEVITEGDSQILKERDYKTKEVGLGRDVNQTIIINKKFETINRSSLPIKFYKENAEALGENDRASGQGDSERNLLGAGSKDKDAKGVGGSLDKSKNISDIDAGLNSGTESSKNKKLDGSKSQSIPDKVKIKNVDEFMDVELSNITDRLLYDFKRKFEEEEYEEDRKIDDLRKEIYSKVTEEVYKMFDSEKSQITDMIEKMRKDMLDQVYMKAKEIVTTNDINSSQKTPLESISKNTDYNQVSNNISENHLANINSDFEISNEENHAEKTLLNSDIIRIPSRESNNNTTENTLSKYEDKTSGYDNYGDEKNNKYSSEDLKIVYEQAVYKMNDNKYDEAASLFKKIIASQPNNKAAMIRLQECLEQNPNLEVADMASDENLDNMIHPEIEDAEIEQNYGEYDYSNRVNVNEEERLINDIENNISKGIATNKRNKRNYSNDELQKMYEEGIYTMFQNNYEDAAKIFQDILRIRPENKAAKIRLQECIGAIHNA